MVRAAPIDDPKMAASGPVFLRAFSALNGSGLAGVLGRGQLPGFSGQDVKDVLETWQCLGLVTRERGPTKRLKSLMSHYGKAQFAETLWKMLREALPALSSIELSEATFATLESHVRDVVGDQQHAAKVASTYLFVAHLAGQQVGEAVRKKADALKVEMEGRPIGTSGQATQTATDGLHVHADAPNLAPQAPKVPPAWSLDQAFIHLMNIYNPALMPQGSAAMDAINALMAALKTLHIPPEAGK